MSRRPTGALAETAVDVSEPVRRQVGLARSRLLWGVPWGSLLICSVIIFVYLFVQNGHLRWREPLVIPFTSWSYRHLLGLFAGPVSHIGPEHLLDNLAGVLAFGTMAEYVYGHRPADTDETTRRVGPRVRALVVFPGTALLAGVVTSVFSWGPTIGFSSVVYAFAGFALVRYPVWMLVAVSVKEAVTVVVRAVDQPVLVASRTLAEPWFVDTAVQGHIFGLLLGVVAGAVTLSRRGDHLPSPAKLSASIVVFGLAQSLWLVWWPRETTFVLARGLGIVLVVCLGAVVATGVGLTIYAHRGTDERELTATGILILLVPLAVMAGVAVPINATGDVTPPPGVETVEVNGYEVTYAESVTNKRLAPLSIATGSDAPKTSGVLVLNQKRGVWTQPVDARALESEKLYLGGIGWEQRVFVVRRAWETAGGQEASQVWVHPDDGLFHRVYTSEPATATAVVAGYNVTIRPAERRFQIALSRHNETVGTVDVPQRGETVTVGTLELYRAGETLVARHNRTRVPIAWRQ